MKMGSTFIEDFIACGTDAHAYASLFMNTVQPEDIDVDIMTAWFANIIETTKNK